MGKLTFTKEEVFLIQQFVSEEKESLSKALEELPQDLMNCAGASNKSVTLSIIEGEKN